MSLQHALKLQPVRDVFAANVGVLNQDATLFESAIRLTNAGFLCERDEGQIYVGDLHVGEKTLEQVCLKRYVREHTYTGFGKPEETLIHQWLPVAGFSMVLATDKVELAMPDRDVSEYHLALDALASRLFPKYFPTFHCGLLALDNVLKVSSWRPSLLDESDKDKVYTNELKREIFDSRMVEMHGKTIERLKTKVGKAGLGLGHAEINFGQDNAGPFVYEVWQQSDYLKMHPFIVKNADPIAYAFFKMALESNATYNVKRHLNGLAHRQKKDIDFKIGVQYVETFFEAHKIADEKAFMDIFFDLNCNPRIDTQFESIDDAKHEINNRVETEFPVGSHTIHLDPKTLLNKIYKCCCMPVKLK